MAFVGLMRKGLVGTSLKMIDFNAPLISSDNIIYRCERFGQYYGSFNALFQAGVYPTADPI